MIHVTHSLFRRNCGVGEKCIFSTAFNHYLIISNFCRSSSRLTLTIAPDIRFKLISSKHTNASSCQSTHNTHDAIDLRCKHFRIFCYFASWRSWFGEIHRTRSDHAYIYFEPISIPQKWINQCGRFWMCFHFNIFTLPENSIHSTEYISIFS